MSTAKERFIIQLWLSQLMSAKTHKPLRPKMSACVVLKKISSAYKQRSNMNGLKAT